MKQQHIFPGMIFIGFGLYFFLQKLQIELLEPYFTWPTILIIVGISFLVQAYKGGESNYIIPGVILTGFGIHFHIVAHFDLWQDSIGIYILIIALSFLLNYQQTSTGLFQGILFLSFAILLMFYDQVIEWLGVLETKTGSLWQYSPVLLIVIGIYLLFIKKK